MIVDITGIVLLPGNGGKDCLGNGEHFYEDGTPIECCCDECDYLLCCTINPTPDKCGVCKDEDCSWSRGMRKLREWNDR